MEESNLGVIYIGFLAAGAPENKEVRYHTTEISGQWYDMCIGFIRVYGNTEGHNKPKLIWT